jgi:hypothetical protein
MGRSTIEEKEGDIYDYGARWNEVDMGRTDELGEKPVPVRLYPLSIILLPSVDVCEYGVQWNDVDRGKMMNLEKNLS